jgi:hypothetical protein
MSEEPFVVLVCGGKHCRHAKGYSDVVELLASTSVKRVGCQDICSSPVVGIRRGTQVRWYSHISGKRLTALGKTIRVGRATARLRSAEVRKRRNKQR